MATNNRIFISFAMEDSNFRDLLVGQAKLEKSPFSFIDMSVKEPWDEKWKTNCRIKIKGCDGVIVLVSKRTASAEGALWEINCAKEESIPIVGIYCTPSDRPASSPGGLKVVDWNWPNVKAFIDSL